jgi:hypothetical protein
MSIGSSFNPPSTVSVTFTDPTLFTITNVTTSATPNTETSFVIAAGAKSFSFHNRDDGVIKFSNVMGNSGTVYWTLYSGQPLNVEAKDSSTAFTFYIQSPKASQVLEVISFL